jgi:hypothetical protein
MKQVQECQHRDHVSVNPYVTVGPAFQTPGYGWGTYLWGDSTWGTARTVSDVILDPGNWSLR